MKNKPAPLLNPGTLKPMTAKELDGVFCDELVQQELDDTTATSSASSTTTADGGHQRGADQRL